MRISWLILQRRLPRRSAWDELRGTGELPVVFVIMSCVAIKDRPFTLQLLLREVYGDGRRAPIDEKYLKYGRCVLEIAVTQVLRGIGTFAHVAEECWENRAILGRMTRKGEMCDSLELT
jgi:hypothetical protein